MNYVGLFFENPQTGLNWGSGSEYSGTDRFYLVQSSDGINLTAIPNTFLSSLGGNGTKDLDIIYYNGRYLCVYSAIEGYKANPPVLGVACSPDLTHWGLISDIDTSPLQWSICPTLAVNPVDNSLHVFFSANPTSATGPANCNIYETHPTNSSLTSWSTPALLYTVTSGNAALDPFYLYDANYSSGAGPHQIWFSLEGAYRDVQVMSCPTIDGTYTDTKTGNWAGFAVGNVAIGSLTTREIEGPFLIQLPSGIWRIWLDGGNLSSTNNSGYWTTTSTTSDPLGVEYAVPAGEWTVCAKTGECNRAV